MKAGDVDRKKDGDDEPDPKYIGLPDIHLSESDIWGSRMTSSTSSSMIPSFDISNLGRKWGSIGDIVKAGVDILSGGIDTEPGLAFSSDPGNKRSINLGDWPENDALGEIFGGAKFVSSNKLLRLFVIESASKRGLGNSLMYGGVLISKKGGWSK